MVRSARFVGRLDCVSPSLYLPAVTPPYFFPHPLAPKVTAGSMWNQEDDDDSDDTPVEKYLVKWTGMSYLHVSWETVADLVELTTTHVKSQVRLLCGCGVGACWCVGVYRRVVWCAVVWCGCGSLSRAGGHAACSATCSVTSRSCVFVHVCRMVRLTSKGVFVCKN